MQVYGVVYNSFSQDRRGNAFSEPVLCNLNPFLTPEERIASQQGAFKIYYAKDVAQADIDEWKHQNPAFKDVAYRIVTLEVK